MKALVTGSGGLIGSAMTELLCESGWTVIGLDNDQRSVFFGPGGSTAGNVRSLQERFPLYRHLNGDVRDRQGMRDLLSAERPEFIVHAAGQPSHDKAASIPYDDFDVNATGTFNLLVAARDYCPEAPFCFTSTNKVYGDRPNTLPNRLHSRRDRAELRCRYKSVERRSWLLCWQCFKGNELGTGSTRRRTATH